MSDLQKKLSETIKLLRESGDLIGSVILAEESATGQKIPSSHLTKIRKWMREDIDVEKIHTFPVIMIDTAPTRNLVIYTEKTQKKSVKGWIGRTVLFNWNGSGNVGFLGQADHSLQASSQVARIYDARIVKTPDGEIGTLGWIFAVEGVDPIIDSFIRKLNAGVIREVSIHVAVPEGIVCSIDEKPFASWADNESDETKKVICFDHNPGNKYSKQVCYMSTGEGKVDPLELSIVACPGSVNARILKPDEVEEYQMTSLSEALGGSKEMKENIMPKKSSESSLPNKTVAELAKDAGLELVEKKDEKEESKCSKCEHDSHEGSCADNCGQCSKDEAKTKEDEEKAKKDKEDEEKAKKDEEEAKKNKKQDPPEEKKDDEKESFLFSAGDCPACGRAEQAVGTSESETIVKLQGQIKQMAAQAEAVIIEAKKKIKANSEKASQYDEIFTLFAEETATLAVEVGAKKFQERDNYIETLKGLSFQAVKEIRASLSVKQVPARKEKEEQLRQSMAERLKGNLGTVIEEENGIKQSSNRISSRPKFGLK